MRPLLMLDVDDTIIWWERGGHKPPYCTTMGSCTRHGSWVKRKILVPRAGRDIPVVLDATLGARLMRAAKDAGADLAWCTGWNDHANRLVGPLLHLPDLEVIPVATWPGKDEKNYPGDGPWKGWNLTEWARTDPRPFAILDNADGLDDAISAVQPHHVVKVDPFTAVTDADVSAAASWLSSL